MKWVMVIVFIYGGKPAMERVEGFTDRRDCVLASTEMRASFRAQLGAPLYSDPSILTFCVKVQK